MEKEAKKKTVRAPRKRVTRKVVKVEPPLTATRVKKVVKEAAAESPTSVDRVYLRAIGRRKEAIAEVRLFRSGSGAITVNGRPFLAYFPRFELQESVLAPLRAVGQTDKVDVAVKVHGGGIRGQADAARLGIARTLIELDPTFRVNLRHLDFLRRDPRVKERKKYGLKKARRAPQWAKR